MTTNTAQTISGTKTFTGGMKVSGRYTGGGDDEGIIVGRADNGYAGLCLGEPSGVRSVFYLTPTDEPLWRYYNGAVYDIKHPGKSGTIALTSDIPTDTGMTSVTVSGGGNAVTSASYSSSTHTLTLTKGSSFMPSTPTSIELNSGGGLLNYGGFIDFHFHDSNGNPKNSSGNIVSGGVDYSSRIIEDSPGRININSVHLKSGSVTASSFVKRDSNDNYVLLGGGGHKALSEIGASDTKVTQDYSTANGSYPLLMTATNGNTSTASRGATTSILSNKIYANPSTGLLTAGWMACDLFLSREYEMSHPLWIDHYIETRYEPGNIRLFNEDLNIVRYYYFPETTGMLTVSSDNTVRNFQVVTSLPSSPNANTIYFIK